MKREPTLRERFESKVDRNGPIPAHRPELGPCHVWTASCIRKGYGQLRYLGKHYLAHRVSFFLTPLPVERVLLDTGQGYREELTVDRVNHATGAVFVSRKAKS